VNAAASAPLVELFWSVQGEGRFVGVPMAFVRTATCPLRCSYCDTPNSYTAPARAPVQGQPDEPNPVSALRAAELLQGLPAAAHASPPRVSVTGGEPLVFPGFVRALGERLRPRGWRLHLETAALDPAALEQCVAEVDHLSADYKLPETLPSGSTGGSFGASFGAEHVRCCALAARRGATVDVKIVLTPSVADASLARALDDLLPLRREVLLVLQPVTPFGREREPLSPEALQRHLAAAQRRGFELRVLPQVHRLLQVP
jgi:organic radical activating enzyme